MKIKFLFQIYFGTKHYVKLIQQKQQNQRQKIDLFRKNLKILIIKKNLFQTRNIQ